MVKYSCLLWERGDYPNTSSMSETLKYLVYLLLSNLADLRSILSIWSLLYFCMGPRQWRHGILQKSAIQRNVSSLRKLLWAELQVATQNIFELALFVMVAIWQCATLPGMYKMCAIYEIGRARSPTWLASWFTSQLFIPYGTRLLSYLLLFGYTGRDWSLSSFAE